MREIVSISSLVASLDADYSLLEEILIDDANTKARSFGTWAVDCWHWDAVS